MALQVSLIEGGDGGGGGEFQLEFVGEDTRYLPAFPPAGSSGSTATETITTAIDISAIEPFAFIVCTVTCDTAHGSNASEWIESVSLAFKLADIGLSATVNLEKKTQSDGSGVIGLSSSSSGYGITLQSTSNKITYMRKSLTNDNYIRYCRAGNYTIKVYKFKL